MNSSFNKIQANNLTVAIPTFNREKKAVELLSRLRQDSESQDIAILISDNFSRDHDTIKAAAKIAGAKLVRRCVNIGPTANILRLFEEATTDWVIILGDDDTVERGFVKKILLELNANTIPDLVAMKFKTSLNNEQTNKVISDIAGFADYCSTPKQFGSTILISSWIYRRESILPYLRYGYLYSGLQAPHLVPLLYILFNKVGKVQYCESSPIIYCQPKKGESWSVGLTYSLMLSNLPAVDALNRNQIKQITRGIVGDSLRSIFGTVYRLKKYRDGIVFKGLAVTISGVSLKHRIIVATASVAVALIDFANIFVGIDWKSENNNVERM